jgi:hypothetical protein
MSAATLIPRLPISSLPKAEQRHAIFVERLLFFLDMHCQEFESALALFDFCYKTKHDSPDFEMHLRWLHIAAQAAATAVYLVKEDIEFLGKNLNKCPTLGNMIDHASRRTATKRFSTHFPGFGGVRHSGQHNAKLYGTPEAADDHSVGSMVLISGLSDRTLQATFEKTVVKLEISAGSLSKLGEVRDLYWAVFRSLGSGT